jgi:hypothetical protein
VKDDVPRHNDGKPVPDWALREIEQEFFSDLAAKLKRGAREGGAALTPEECQVLFELVRDSPAPKRSRGRPTKSKDADWIMSANWRMALYCLHYESRRGMPSKAAVEITMQAFGAKRSAVYAARRRFLSSK